MRSLRAFGVLSVLLGTLSLLGPLPAAQASEPCCNVVAVNAAKGVVKLKDARTGRTCEVTVRNKAWVKALQVAEAADRNVSTTLRQ